MLRYKTETRPGLVTLYDIQPGNGAGLFLQSQSQHGAGDRKGNRLQKHCFNSSLFNTDIN